MEQTKSIEVNFENVSTLPQHIQFEVIEDELLAIARPTVQLYEQA